MNQRYILISGGIVVVIAAVLLLVIFSNAGLYNLTPANNSNSGNTDAGTTDSNDDQGELSERLSSRYLSSYELNDPEFGTEVNVTVSGNTRTIRANALPNHETGDFPNSGNPNSIKEQSKTYSFPVKPTFTGTAREVREPGVAINGVKFEPGTAEQVTCTSNQTYRIEAIQDMTDLGLDFNNAHVQPDGTYHYHGVPAKLVEAFDDEDDLVHVGFAADGHLIYYSKSGAYRPSYQLNTAKRSSSNCTYRGQVVNINGTAPDGTYVSDWKFNAELGDLDECNGATIDGTYVYFMTQNYPYISRCLKGQFTETSPTGGAPGQVPPGGGQVPPGGVIPPRPR